MIEKGLTLLIDGDAGVNALALSGGYLGQLPANAPLPAWTFTFVSYIGNYTLKSKSSLSMRRMQIDCYGNTAAEAVLLANAIGRVVDGYSGTLSDEDATKVSTIQQSNLIDFFDSAARTQRRMLEYEVHFHDVVKQ